MRKSRILMVSHDCVRSKFQSKGSFLTLTAAKEIKFPIKEQ